nr:YraN family protein [Nocardiopsis trehalosi]
MTAHPHAGRPDPGAARRARLGRRGEAVAAALLRKEGLRILARNWRCAEGEIDIVARWGTTLVVTEVKTRTSLRFGSPLEAVSAAKLARLRRLAHRWAAETGTSSARVRIDVVSVLVAADGRTFARHHRGVA